MEQPSASGPQPGEGRQDGPGEGRQDEEVLPGSGICENCDREGGNRVPVHRIYLVPGPDGKAPPTPVKATEMWCVSCRTLYPHELSEA